MRFLNKLWNRNYQLILMSEGGGWTRSYWLRFGQFVVALSLAVLAALALLAGWVVLLPRLADYNEIQGENRLLASYRDKVRHALLNSDRFNFGGVDLIQELELAIDLDEDGQPGLLDRREGGIFLDDIYINFLENIPTYPPVNGYVTRGLLLHELDLQVNHEGVDIAASAGDMVSASAAGLVVLSRWTEDLGYMIILSHGHGYFTLYGHNRTNLVSPRQWVERGQPIGLVGETGISQGPHLHFEIWKDGRAIDPRLFIDLYRLQDVSVETHG